MPGEGSCIMTIKKVQNSMIATEDSIDTKEEHDHLMENYHSSLVKIRSKMCLFVATRAGGGDLLFIDCPSFSFNLFPDS